MNNQPTSAVIAGLMSGVAAACVCLTIVLALQNRSLESQLRDSRRLWSEAVNSTADLRVLNASTAADLAAHRQRMADLERDLAGLEAKVSSEATVSSRPIPVRIFDGTRFVGVGWIPASATNRAGLAGEGVASVFLDRRASAETAFESAPASGPAAASVSALITQQYPYYWPGVWMGWGAEWDPEDPGGSIPDDPVPQPTTPPTASPTVPAPAPVQNASVRTGAGQRPPLSVMATRPASFQPRIPTAAPTPRRSSSAVSTSTRSFAPRGGTRVSPGVARPSVPVGPVRR